MHAGVDTERAQIVRLFGRYDCLIEPQLVEYLAAKDDPGPLAEAVLRELGEVPFYLTLASFRDAEERIADRPQDEDDGGGVPKPAVDPAHAELEAARKAALAKMLEMVYDAQRGDLETADDLELDGSTEPAEAPDKRQHVEPLARPVVKVNRPKNWDPIASHYDGQIKILQDITGQSTCEGNTGDFHKYFTARYHAMEKLLRKRRELANAVPIERALDAPGREVAIIGMVTESRTTNAGHKLLEVEDESGKIAALVVNNDRTDPALIVRAGLLVPDEVLGVVAQKAAKGDLLIVQDLIRPDIPYNTERIHAEEPLAAAFLSDVHVGSDIFLEKNFVKMLQWLNGETGNERERKMAGRIKYLVVPGDMVDGIGIYPGQEHNLTIGDIYDQYEYFGELMRAVPDHVDVIVQPGNHDAARPNEPQPALDKEAVSKFDGLNARFVGNPSTFTLHDVRVLSYHGCSLMDFATSVQGMEHHDPLPIMEEILKCRHLAPIYGQSTPLAPEHKDYMVIDTIPDLFVTGHVHTFDTRQYRGINMMNCSTWQGQTDYQKMLNFKPNPAMLPIFDLQHLKSTAMDFTMGMDFTYGNKVA